MPRIGIVAGEQSGDLLAASLVNSLSKIRSDFQFEGIGGANMRAAGVRIHYPMERLAVMGISEVLRHCFSLWQIRRRLYHYFLQQPPDIFIGVDAPDFNFWLEKKLRKAGVKTIHLVSPSIWGWREYRVKSIYRSTDLMLTLFPFEGDIYRRNNIPVQYIGHPLADQLPSKADRDKACERLGLDKNKIHIALLPGSREIEIDKISPPFLRTAVQLLKEKDNIQFITSFNNQQLRRQFDKIKQHLAPDHFDIITFINRSHQVIEAADLLLLASGTVSLEAMLLNKPMIVGYKAHWLTYWLLRCLYKLPYVSLPNILCKAHIVPEYLQGRCTPEYLVPALLSWLEDKQRVQSLQEKFSTITPSLRRDAGLQAARSVIKLYEQDNEC